MKNFISENKWLFVGILIGLYLSSIIQETFDIDCEDEKIKNETIQGINNAFTVKPLPKIKSQLKPSSSKKPKLIRPRYYSTELGIREKLFVGIFTSEENVNVQAVHINKTIGHLVDKIKFFITAQYKLKTKFNLTGLVGFTDSRYKYRPFQVVKYISDSFPNGYDYYFLANDFTFINVHSLKDLVDKISISMDVYLGQKVPDSSYCNLDSGILLSNSAIQAMRTHLDWCIMNAVSESYSENIGRCLYHSFGLSCQETVQDQVLKTLKVKHFELKDHFLNNAHNEVFNEAVTVYPVLKKEDFYVLNAYYLQQRLKRIKKQIDLISEDLTDNWPPGQRTGAKPATRFDVPKQHYFNMTHVFFPDDFTNIRPHTDPEKNDLENIVREIKAKVGFKYKGALQLDQVINGYKTFDLSRGMDYILDIAFTDLRSGKSVLKRFEVCKPLGKVEFIPMPYVTESTRITMIIPVEESDVKDAKEFLEKYVNLIMDRKEKTCLMLIFFYQYNSSSQGNTDVFLELKQRALKVSAKYKNDDTKIAWVSIRLPEYSSEIKLRDYPSLSFAMVDLALKKVGVDNLVLVLDIYSEIGIDFLNRVRLNTIQGYQIFNPIPFKQYNPKISQTEQLEINKNTGHFDKDEYKYISFYGRDYVIARKRYKLLMPLIRVDLDISQILKEPYRKVGNLFQMFVEYYNDLHCMRATEMSLKIRYKEGNENESSFLGSEVQIAKLLLTNEDKIAELQ